MSAFRKTVSKRCALAVALALAASAAAHAGTGVAIRFYDDNRQAQGSTLSAAAHAELERAAQVGLVAKGRDADGAFVFAFAHPQSNEAERAALTRLRATGAVMYAEPTTDAPLRTKVASVAADEPVTSLIVTLKPAAKRAGGLAIETRARVEHTVGAMVTRSRVLSGGRELVELNAPLGAAAAAVALQKLAADPDIAHVEIDRRARVTAMPADPMLSQQWNLIDAAGGINAPAAWDFATGDPGVPIAVLDTGFTAHPELAGRAVAGYDFIANPAFSNDGDGRDGDPADPGDWVTSAESTTPGSPLQACPVTNSTWHGTMVGGTLGATVNNNSGVSGVNWSSPIISVRVLGKCGGALSDVADGIRWAAGLPVPGAPANPMPARVINLSMAGPGICGTTLQSAVTDALAQGAVLVAAAGNDNDDVENHWPANCNGVIAVAATSRNGSRAFYSSNGARVAVSAPGGGVGGSIPTLRNSSTTAPDPNGYIYGQQLGSSLAAPHVSGAISLALSLDRDLSGAELRALLERTARPFPTVPSDQCTTAICGAGIVDAAAAVSALARRAPIDAKPTLPPEDPSKPAPAPSDPPLPAPAPAPAPEPTPVATRTPPPASLVPVPGGWRAKTPHELQRLHKPRKEIGPTR